LSRERALKLVFDREFPALDGLVTHESSPSNRGFSNWLKANAPNHCVSFCYPGHASGDIVNGFRNEDIQSLSFADNSIDIHVTQNVFEHVMHPERAFAEIARTLKPGGAHIFTVPLPNGKSPTQRRAREENGHIEFMKPPVYHGNPIDPKGTLVTFDYGYDIVSLIATWAGMPTSIWVIDNALNGVRPYYTHTLVSYKPTPSQAC